jgi:hypothetical protein
MTPDATEATSAGVRFTLQCVAAHQKSLSTPTSAQPNRVTSNETGQAEDSTPLVFTPSQVEKPLCS